MPRPFDAGQRRRLVKITEAQQGNVSVYSAYRPFAGSGKTRRRLVHRSRHRPGSAEGREVETFTALEVHDFVRDQLRDLRTGTVTMTDRVFVDGRDIRDDLRFLPEQVGAPVTAVDPALLRSLTIESEDRARPYLCIQVSGWQGQLVHSTFLRFVVTPHELFVEASHFLLTPVRDEFQEVDRLLPEPTAGQALRIGGRALRRTPGHLFRAPIATVARLIGPAMEEQPTGQAEAGDPQRAPVRPRRSAQPARDGQRRWYQRYFQQLDHDWYTKVIDKRLFQSLTEFLESKGIDTAS